MLALTGAIPPHDVADPLDPRGAINFVPTPGSRWRAVRRLYADQAVDLATGEVRHADHGIRPLACFAAAARPAADELVRFARELAARAPGPDRAAADRRARFTHRRRRLPRRRDPVRDHDPPLRRQVADRRAGRGGDQPPLRAPPPGGDARDAARHRCRRAARRHTARRVLDWDHTHVLPGKATATSSRRRDDRRRLLRARPALLRPVLRRSRLRRCLRSGDLGAPRHGAGPAGSDRLPRRLARLAGGHMAGIDWANAFYFDQRITAWRASVEHGYDLLPMVVLHPANNTRRLSALVTPEPRRPARRPAAAGGDRPAGAGARALPAQPPYPRRSACAESGAGSPGSPARAEAAGEGGSGAHRHVSRRYADRIRAGRFPSGPAGLSRGAGGGPGRRADRRRACRAAPAAGGIGSRGFRRAAGRGRGRRREHRQLGGGDQPERSAAGSVARA